MAQETVRHIYAEASAVQDREARRRLARHAERSEQARAMRAMLSHAEPMLVSSAADFDADPWLLNVPNGTLELRAGTLRPHRREDRLTKLCPVAYHPEAKAPRWEQFLGEVFQGNAALISFLQRWVGYTLTGDSSERKFVILHGPGKNGKSTFVETLRFILGSDYAAHANSETFLRKRLGTIPADLASLQGKRLVTVAETGEGRSLDAATIKTATGRDRLKVRLLHHNFFEYTPQFKLYLSTNHKPDIPADDQAVWDRVRLIPFRRTFEEHEQDKHLDEKLRSEAPGILAWAVQGCLQWQKDGLAVPDTVTAATLQYRSEMDVIAQFLQDCCVLQPSATVRPKQLHEAYATWCAENAEKPLGLRKFGENVKRRGYRTRLTMGNAVWDGLGLRLAHECA
jgi:putative DNA primase/helicase